MNKNILIGVLALVILGGGAVLLFNYGSGTPATPDTNVTPTPTPTPTPSAQAKAPAVITDANNFFVSNSTALVTGKVTPNGAQTFYSYEYGATPSLGMRTAEQGVGSGWIQIPAPAYISGLSANSIYYFRVSARNFYGTVNGGIYSFTTNSNPPVPGIAPTTSTDAATDVSRTTANLNGHVNPNNASTSDWFEYGETTDLGSATSLQSAGSGNASLSASVSLSNLKPLTKYYFRLNSQNAYGTVNGSIKNFTTSGPAASGAPKVDTTDASNIATSTAKFNGQVNPNGAVTGYWFEYGTDSQLGSILDSTTKITLQGSGMSDVTVSATVKGLTRNTRYYFRVIGENSLGLTRGDIVNFKTNN